jgi:aspartate aminotransferase
VRLSKRVSGVKASPTFRVKAEAQRLRESGVDVLDFGPGEPDFDTPAAIREAAKQALDRGDTHYGPTAGNAELRRALAGYSSERHGGGWSPSEVVVGVGGKGVLYLLMQALVDPGDEVLVFAPYWVSFPEQVRLAGGEPVALPTDATRGFVPDPAVAAGRIGPRTRAIILNSPSNPTGAVIPRQVLAEFADLAARQDLLLIADETYDRFVYPGHEFASCSELRERAGGRVVVVNSFSKTYAMTGWRVGFGLGPEELIAAVARIQGHDVSHPTSFVQTAALAALELDDAPVRAMLEEYTRRRQRILDGLATIPGMELLPPGGAFYVFPSVKELCRQKGCATSKELVERILLDARVASVPGEAFGAEGFLRLSYALSVPRIDEGIARLRAFAAGA